MSKRFMKLTPGSRLFIMILLVTSILIATPFIGMGTLLILLVVLFHRQGLSLGKLALKLGYFWLIIVAVGLLQVLFPSVNDHSPLLWQWRFLEVSRGDLVLFYHFILRFFLMVGYFHYFERNLSVNEISYGVEEMFLPLERIGFSAHRAGLVMTITFRFIPLFKDELDRVEAAQRARGAMPYSKKGGLIKKVKARFPLIIPLFISALTSAEHLIEAMEARGYQDKGPRSRFKSFQKAPGDYLAILMVILLLTGLITIKILDIESILGVMLWNKIEVL